MNKNRWKRLLSLMLALTMILSWNRDSMKSQRMQRRRQQLVRHQKNGQGPVQKRDAGQS